MLRRSIELIISAIGDNSQREGLLDTPDRVIKSWEELFAGYKEDPKKLLKTFDSEGYVDVVLVRDIYFNSMCEHHMLPFSGIGHIAYRPSTKIVGLSKLPRLLNAFARRLQTQERITTQVAEALIEYIGASGAACMLEASHSCVGCRGVKQQASKTVTTTFIGSITEEIFFRRLR